MPDLRQPIVGSRYEAVRGVFQRTADRWPEHPALEAGRTRWSYGELAGRVADIEQRLAEAGMRPGDVVGLTGRSCPELVASVLAILGRLGVLLTLDPELSDERRRTLQVAAGANWLMTASGDGRLRIDGVLGRRRSFAPDAGYIFFTSGTSGVPKAVVGTQNALAHFLDWQRRMFGIGPGARCAQLIGLSFDAVLRDLLLPLTSGASLHIPGEDHDARSGEVLTWLASEAITVLHTVPSLASAWLASEPRTPVRSLRHAFFSGEPLDGDFVRRWRHATSSSCEVVNLYGPTETTMVKTWYVVPARPSAGPQPAGLPFPETEVVVLRPDFSQCAAGEAGEIGIRTPHRTLGYLNNRDEQRRRFVRNPYRQDEDDLIYLTGDRGCWGQDGLLHVLGRQDDQVKIHGVRIEVGEVESVLARHPAVAQAAVFPERVKDSATGAAEICLKALIVPAPGSQLTQDTLRAHLLRGLPAAAVPASILAVGAVPLLPNGKIDRRRLPDWARAGRVVSSVFIEPRTGTERQLAEIWARVLGRPAVGARDDFFASGGDSLRALRLFAEIEHVFGCRLPVRLLLEAGTVERLAAHLDRPPAPRDPLVALKCRGTRPPLFCVHPIGGETFCYRKLADSQADDQPVYGLAADSDEIGDGEITVEGLASKYLASLRRVQQTGPYRLCGFSFGGSVAYEMARQLLEKGEEVALLAIIDEAPTAAHVRSSPGRLLRNAARRLPSWLGEGHIGRKLSFWTWKVPHMLLAQQWTAETLPLRIMEQWFPPERIPLVRTFYSAARRYRPRPCNARLLLFRANALPVLSPEDPEAAWSRLARGGIDVCTVPGSHLKMLESPGVETIAARLRRDLATAPGRAGNRSVMALRGAAGTVA